mmetsp:Transcript_71977/g.131360  ORF Transcript_71977/g.131360 Transcript_71977/m.131360 type:complete len:103 (-) Transcript_71977:67-375(-)
MSLSSTFKGQSAASKRSKWCTMIPKSKRWDKKEIRDNHRPLRPLRPQMGQNLQTRDTSWHWVGLWCLRFLPHAYLQAARYSPQRYRSDSVVGRPVEASGNKA